MPSRVPSQIGRYRVLAVQYEGRTATLCRARDPVLGREVTLKTLSPPLASDVDERRQRLYREAQVLAPLKHPNVVTAFDVAEDRGTPYMVLEPLDGRTLRQAVDSGINLKAGLSALVDVLNGLAYIHGHGVVHRDIKPSNIFITTGGRVLITDFFLASTMVPSVTRVELPIGTPGYMSPEQAAGAPVDGRSDLFSVGCVLFEVVTGQLPLLSDSDHGIVDKVLRGEPDAEVWPSGPPWDALLLVVSRALQKRPPDRYPDARSMLADLAPTVDVLADDAQTRTAAPPQEGWATGQTREEAPPAPPVIAIDLGTVSSRVAVVEDGVPRVIPNQEGSTVTPSTVAFTAEGECLVGGPASRQALANPEATVHPVLRLVGRTFGAPEIAQAQRGVHYPLVEGLDGDVPIRIRDKVYSTVEVLSLLLNDLKASAESDLGVAVDEVVLTCPAAFGDSQREALREAGTTAGFTTVHLLDVTRAAAIGYRAHDKARTGVVAIYHLGGGSFEVSVVEMTANGWKLRATTGDAALGGADFDQRIVDWLVAEFRRQFGRDLPPDAMTLVRLREAAEKAKLELSDAAHARIAVPFVTADPSGPKHLNAVLRRSDYDALTRDLLDRTVEACRRCLADAHVGPDQIDAVLLVGGQSQAPRVRDLMRRLFGREPTRLADSDGGIVIGAALRAGLGAEVDSASSPLADALDTASPATADDAWKTVAPVRTEVLPMVPLRDRVVFPAMMVPLAVGRPSSVRAFEHAMARGNRVFLAAQLAAARDNPTPGELYQLGTLCRIAMSVKTPHGGLRVVVEGVERGRILELTGEQSFFEAVAGILPRTVTTGPGIDALVSRASRLFERYVRLLDPSRPDAPFSADDLRDPDKLANTICAYMAVSIEEKQALLSFLSPAEQLDRVISTLGAEIGRFTRAKKLGKLFSRRRSE